MIRLRVVPSLFAGLLVVACTSDPGGEEQGTDEGGDQPEAVILYIDSDASSVCSSGSGTVELVTRRVDCWDPPLPCTLAQNPPWLVGTTGDCSALSGSSRWEVTVTQTGRWETRLQSSAAAGQPAQAIECLGLGGEARTNVSRDDLAERAEFLLAPAPAGPCGEP